MKYMLLIYQGDTPTPQSPEAWATLSEDEQKAVYADYQAINQTPGVTPGLGLDMPETATTVRVQDGKTLTTDGPFVEIKESIGGYLVFEADDLDAAIALASRIPTARLGGAVEVRWAAKAGPLQVPEPTEEKGGPDGLPRRAARAHLHVLSPGALGRRTGRAHAADARRPDHRRDRPRLPGPRADDGPAPGAGEAQRSRPPGSRSGCLTTTCCPIGSSPCSQWSI